MLIPSENLPTQFLFAVSTKQQQSQPSFIHNSSLIRGLQQKKIYKKFRDLTRD